MIVPGWKSKRKIFRNQIIRQINSQGENHSEHGSWRAERPWLGGDDFDRLLHFFLFPRLLHVSHSHLLWFLPSSLMNPTTEKSCNRYLWEAPLLTFLCIFSCLLYVCLHRQIYLYTHRQEESAVTMICLDLKWTKVWNVYQPQPSSQLHLWTLPTSNCQYFSTVVFSPRSGSNFFWKILHHSQANSSHRVLQVFMCAFFFFLF